MWNWNDVISSAPTRATAVLIVPCGIEIILIPHLCVWMQSLNRTMWNWNRRTVSRWTKRECLNRTMWNWNPVRVVHARVAQQGLNRTMWNWNQIQQIPPTKAPYVLIVPCGIEITKSTENLNSFLTVLIVPCGIEMNVARLNFIRLNAS